MWPCKSISLSTLSKRAETESKLSQSVSFVGTVAWNKHQLGYKYPQWNHFHFMLLTCNSFFRSWATMRSFSVGPGSNRFGKFTFCTNLIPIWCGLYVFDPVENIRYLEPTMSKSSSSDESPFGSVSSSSSSPASSSSLIVSSGSFELFSYSSRYSLEYWIDSGFGSLVSPNKCDSAILSSSTPNGNIREE